MVEFAIVFPVALIVIIGTIAGSFLFFQSEAVTNGARCGARWATIETSLYVASGPNFCESGNPDTIINAVKKSANILNVNTTALCTVGGSTTELQQTNDPTKANIVVDAIPSLASPTCITVTVTYKANPLSLPFRTQITLRGYSSAPVPSSSSSTTTTTTTTSTGINCPAPH
jgi:Flp pilus assembly protein TadG